MTNNPSAFINKKSTRLPAITSVLPHKAPMILIDNILAVAEESIQCQLTVTTNHTFFDPQISGIPAWVGIELMAQSVAAWSGYHALQKNSKPPMGFLLGSRRYKSNCSYFTDNIQLHIFATRLMENNGMAVFDCRIESNGNILATGQLNAYVPSKEKLDQLLKNNDF